MHTPLQYLGEGLAILCALLWAFAVIFFRKSGETVHPLALNVFKNILAIILFALTTLIFGQVLLPSFPFKIYLIFILSGVLGIGLGDTLFFHSLNRLGAGLTGIVLCMYSPFIITMSVLILAETLTILQVIGALLIVAAVLIATYEKEKRKMQPRQLFFGVLLGILSSLSTAAGVIMIKPLINAYPILWLTEIRLAGGIISLALVLLFYPKRKKIIGSLLKSHGRAYTIIGSFFGAFLAMFVWLVSFKYTQASIASALHETSVIFIFIFAGIILREPINFRRMLGIILAFIGSFLVSFG